MMRIRTEKLEFKMSQIKVSGTAMWDVGNGNVVEVSSPFNIIISEAIASIAPIASSSILETVQNGQRFSKLKIIKCIELNAGNAIDLLTLR